ncbi:MAG: hypothetical protein WC964_04050 [Acholeplasmataceae bacterium]
MINLTKAQAKLEQGFYVTDDGMSHVILYGDKEFSFNRHIATSYLPRGNYSIVKGKLILSSKGNEEFIFEIKDGYLVFISGNLPDGMIQSGTIFRLSSNDD